MKKVDEKINDALSSLDHLNKAEPNPYLFEKIKTKIGREAESHFRLKWALVTTTLFFVMINATIIYKYYNTAKQQQTEEVLVGLTNALNPTAQLNN